MPDDFKKQQAKFYNDFIRDPESRAFYESPAWRGRHGSRTIKMKRTPACERCLIVAPDMVHHIIPLKDCTEDQKTDQNNLRALCWPCHNTTHAEMDKATVKFVTGQLEPVDDVEFVFDEQRSTSVERFAAKYCTHWRGPRRGKPFTLDPIQLEFLRPFYGFVERESRLRCFLALWMEQGIGSGKTPVMAIMGLENLLTVPGAQVYSVSNTFAQANHTFDAAKMFIKNNEHLGRMVERGKLRVKQYEIVYTPTDSKWNIVSGDGSQAGAAASCLLIDEIHQIENRNVYDDLQGRQSKRAADQPICVCATNAAKRPQSLYADLHEEAEHTLTSGPRYNRRLLPVIWAAPPEADPSSPDSWRLANKMIGITIPEKSVSDEWERSKGSPALTARFRLQYLGQQVSAVERWIDLDAWDACSQPFDAKAVAGLPLYVGIDSSGGDDLLAVVKCWPSLARIYAEAKFWLPQATADKYLASDEIRYDKWADAGDIALIKEPTISIEVQQRIAAEIIAMHKVTPITEVSFDRAYSEYIIADLRAAGIKCEKVPQGWGVSSGCRELDRRLKERSVTISPNAVFRFNAENACVKHDERGNYWPIKPNASGRYAGKRSAKIDGLSAFVTALTRAREHDFPQQDNSVGAWIVNLDDGDDD